MLEVFCVCLVFRPLVSVYGLFPVLVSCNLVNSFQVCVICECVFKSCLLNSTSSGLLVIPGVSTLPCVTLMLSLKTIILKYVLVCVFLVSPCCVHRDSCSLNVCVINFILNQIKFYFLKLLMST